MIGCCGVGPVVDKLDGNISRRYYRLRCPMCDRTGDWWAQEVINVQSKMQAEWRELIKAWGEKNGNSNEVGKSEDHVGEDGGDKSVAVGEDTGPPGADRPEQH